VSPGIVLPKTLVWLLRATFSKRFEADHCSQHLVESSGEMDVFVSHRSMVQVANIVSISRI
jgi:hypothetical protein